MIDAAIELNLPRGDAFAAPGEPPSLVVGPENRLLLPPVERLLADEAGENLADLARLFNPLVLIGPSGSGKSHLVQGLARRFRAALAEGEVAYFTAADFGREMQAAQADDALAPWRAGVRELRLLVIEDLHLLRARSTIQQELRYAIDAIVDGGGLVIATAHRELASLGQLEPGLRDRLAAGLAVRIQRPGVAARRTLVRLAARAYGLTISEEEVARIARREAGTPAQVLGEVASLARANPADNGDDSRREPRTAAAAAREFALMKRILAVTARYFTITQTALTGPSRRTSLVAARNVAVHLARDLTSLSYADIGRALGGRDHTTVMHAHRRLTAQRDADPTIQQAVEELDRLLR